MDRVLSFWDTIDSPTFALLSDRDLSNNFVCAFEHPILAPPRSPPITSGLRFQQLTLLPIPHVHSDHQASPSLWPPPLHGKQLTKVFSSCLHTPIPGW